MATRQTKILQTLPTSWNVTDVILKLEIIQIDGRINLRHGILRCNKKRKITIESGQGQPLFLVSSDDTIPSLSISIPSSRRYSSMIVAFNVRPGTKMALFGDIFHHSIVMNLASNKRRGVDYYYSKPDDTTATSVRAGASRVWWLLIFDDVSTSSSLLSDISKTVTSCLGSDYCEGFR